ncbi:MAG: hypothetical protein Q7V00_06855 [Sulfurimicrobium sp.]|nr:hypothetical protein [Sulfurimicrobium sp.]
MGKAAFQRVNQGISFLDDVVFHLENLLALAVIDGLVGILMPSYLDI